MLWLKDGTALVFDVRPLDGEGALRFFVLLACVTRCGRKKPGGVSSMSWSHLTISMPLLIQRRGRFFFNHLDLFFFLTKKMGSPLIDSHFSEFKSLNFLRDAWHLKHPTEKQFTWFNSNLSSTSRLDSFLISRFFRQKSETLSDLPMRVFGSWFCVSWFKFTRGLPKRSGSLEI